MSSYISFGESSAIVKKAWSSYNKLEVVILADSNLSLIPKKSS